MSASLLDLGLRSALLLLLVWGAAIGVRRLGGSAAMRHLVWLAGLGGAFALPLLALLLPQYALPILPAVPEASAVATGPAPFEAASGLWAALAWALYLAGAGLLLFRLAIGRLALARLWAQSRAADRDWAALVNELAAALAIRRPVALRLAPGPVMPMTWGIFSARVLLPAEAAQWSERRRRIVLLHELAHVARRDSLGQLAAGVVCALYWFQPVVWLAARRLKVEQEHACDDLVLLRGAEADVYARELLDIARGFRAPALAAATSIGMARPTELEQRLTAIVGRRPRQRPGGAFASFASAGALIVAALFAVIVPVAASLPARAGGQERAPLAEMPAAPPVPAVAPAAPPAPQGHRVRLAAPAAPPVPPVHIALPAPPPAIPATPPVPAVAAVPALPARPTAPTPPTPPPALPAAPASQGP